MLGRIFIATVLFLNSWTVFAGARSEFAIPAKPSVYLDFVPRHNGTTDILLCEEASGEAFCRQLGGRGFTDAEIEQAAKRLSAMGWGGVLARMGLILVGAVVGTGAVPAAYLYATAPKVVMEGMLYTLQALHGVGLIAGVAGGVVTGVIVTSPSSNFKASKILSQISVQHPQGEIKGDMKVLATYIEKSLLSVAAKSSQGANQSTNQSTTQSTLEQNLAKP